MISLSEYWPKSSGKQMMLRTKSELAVFEAAGTGWVYGELTEQGIDSMMEHTPKKDGVFVDLGSGRGLIPAYVKVNYNYHKCVGVELSASRCKVSNEIKDQAIERFNLSDVHFLNQNLFDYDLGDADVIFTNNLAFGLKPNTRLFTKVNTEAKQGSYFVCIHPPTDFTVCPRLTQVLKTEIQTSWMDACPLYVFLVGQ